MYATSHPPFSFFQSLKKKELKQKHITQQSLNTLLTLLPHLFLLPPSTKKPPSLTTLRKPNPAPRRIINRIIIFQKLLPNNRIHTTRTSIINPRIILPLTKSKIRILRLRNQILLRRQRKFLARNSKTKIGRGARIKCCETRVIICCTPRGCRRQKFVVGGCGDVNECGSRVDDSGGVAASEVRVAEGEGGEGEAPVGGRGTGAGFGEVGYGAAVFGAVDAAEGEFAVAGAGGAAGDGGEVYAEDFGGDAALFVEVVHECSAGGEKKN